MHPSALRTALSALALAASSGISRTTSRMIADFQQAVYPGDAEAIHGQVEDIPAWFVVRFCMDDLQRIALATSSCAPMEQAAIGWARSQAVTTM